MASVKTTQQQAEEHFREVLKGFEQAMLVTHSDEIGMHARPMAIAGSEDDGSVWFISGEDTPKVAELHHDRTTLAVMQSGVKSLAISGRSELTRDRDKIHALWKETFRAWFEGKDDPNILLIRLRPEQAEYWDNSGLKGIKFAMKLAAAYVSGKTLSQDAGDDDVDVHAKLRL